MQGRRADGPSPRRALRGVVASYGAVPSDGSAVAQDIGQCCGCQHPLQPYVELSHVGCVHPCHCSIRQRAEPDAELLQQRLAPLFLAPLVAPLLASPFDERLSFQASS